MRGWEPFTNPSTVSPVCHLEHEGEWESRPERSLIDPRLDRSFPFSFFLQFSYQLRWVFILQRCRHAKNHFHSPQKSDSWVAHLVFKTPPHCSSTHVKKMLSWWTEFPPSALVRSFYGITLNPPMTDADISRAPHNSEERHRKIKNLSGQGRSFWWEEKRLKGQRSP